MGSHAKRPTFPPIPIERVLRTPRSVSRAQRLLESSSVKIGSTTTRQFVPSLTTYPRARSHLGMPETPLAGALSGSCRPSGENLQREADCLAALDTFLKNAWRQDWTTEELARLLDTEVNNKEFKALMAKLDELQLSEISQLKREISQLKR